MSDYYDAFFRIGYDKLEVIFETITEELLEKEFITEIPLLGQRKKSSFGNKEDQRKY